MMAAMINFLHFMFVNSAGRRSTLDFKVLNHQEKIILSGDKAFFFSLCRIAQETIFSGKISVEFKFQKKLCALTWLVRLQRLITLFPSSAISKEPRSQRHAVGLLSFETFLTPSTQPGTPQAPTVVRICGPSLSTFLQDHE